MSLSSRMSVGDSQKLNLEEVGDVTVATFTDKKMMDEHNIQIKLFALVDERDHRKILLDFSNVEYLSSVVLVELVTLDKKARSAGGQVRFCHVRAEIRDIFAITRLDKLFQFFENRQSALDGF